MSFLRSLALRLSSWRLASPSLLRRTIAVFSTIVFLIVALHSPIAVHSNLVHDDALFMTLGKDLATGRWLGPYSQFTLMKGPGYPAFLALNSWLGLPIGLSHAAFQCAAIGLFFWVVSRTTSMPNLALFGFVFTLWAPAPYLFASVMRAAIYPGETLLVLATLYYALFGDLLPNARIRWALLSGLLSGWFFLTREAGVWIAPGVAIIVFYGAWCAWRKRVFVRDALTPLLAALIALMTVRGGFHTLNWIAYGKATGVETNSAPFKDALGVLQSVDAGARIPYVPVSRQARFAIYAVSPSFSSLKDYFDPANGSTPWQFGCSSYPQSCGDIAGGWFMWALRDAVASKGYYSSPARAAAFYRQLIKEVTKACREHRLKCSPSLFALLPHISAAQWGKLPSSLYSGIRLITDLEPVEISQGMNFGSPKAIDADVAFLGNPVTPPQLKSQNEYHVAGWYRSSPGHWVSGQFRMANGQEQIFPIQRNASPDLVQAFKDSSATMDRFNFTLKCSSPCNFSFVDSSGATLPLNLEELSGQHFSRSFGRATLYIDTITNLGDIDVHSGVQTRAAMAVLRFFNRAYSIFLPWLAGTALLAVFFLALQSLITRRIDALAVLAVAVWSLIASRLLLLGLVDISSFHGIQPRLLAPAYVLICLAIVLTFAALKASRSPSAS